MAKSLLPLLTNQVGESGQITNSNKTIHGQHAWTIPAVLQCDNEPATYTIVNPRLNEIDRKDPVNFLILG